MPYTNNNGQTRVGIRSGVLVAQTPSASTLWNSIYAVYNGDSVGSQSLKTSLYAVYNGESNTNDSFGTNNGTAVGSVTYTTGKIGNAFTLNGTNAYVNLPRTTNEFDFTGDFSISVWIKPTASSANYKIFQNFYGTTVLNRYGYNLYLQNGLVRFATYANNSNIANSSTAIVGNTWYHITITKTVSNAFKMYINGVLQTLTTTDGNISNNPTYNALNQVNIGSTFNNGTRSDYFNGQIDALNTWTKELSASEVSELYNSGNGSQYIGDSFYRPTTGDELYNNNGTAQGGLTYVQGKVGTAFQFNGTNAYVSLPNTSGQFNLTGDFSVSCWFKTNTVSGYQLIFSNLSYNGGARKGFYIILSTNTIGCWLVNQPTYSQEFYTSSVVSINTWYHLSVTRESGVVKIYLNGTLLATDTNAIPLSYVTTLTSIGAYTNGLTPILYYFNGNIDAFNIWQKALTQSEITELYNSGNGKQYVNTNIITNGLILNLDASNTSSYSGTGTTWTNLVGGSYNATLYNGVSYTSTNSGGLTFDGVNDYVLLNSANKPSTTSANSGFSFGMWFNLNGWSSGKGILQIAYPNSLTSTTPTFLINTVNTDQIQYYIGGAGWAGSTTLTNKNAPQYFAFTVSSNASSVTILKVYINGVYQFTVNNPFDLGTFNNKDIYIGNGYNGFMSMNCYSVHMYNNKTLTDAEVLQNYINTKSRFGL